jgi:hypothetical protein
MQIDPDVGCDRPAKSCESSYYLNMSDSKLMNFNNAAALKWKPVKGWSFHCRFVQISNQNCKKKNRVSEEIEATRKNIYSRISKLPFPPKREANFIQQVLFGSRWPIGNFPHLKISEIQYVWPHIKAEIVWRIVERCFLNNDLWRQVTSTPICNEKRHSLTSGMVNFSSLNRYHLSFKIIFILAMILPEGQSEVIHTLHCRHTKCSKLIT